MALHKLWLSKKPERSAAKKPKDARQGDVLLSACRYFLADSYPMDLDFVFDLPAELRDIFTAWAETNEFDPNDPGAVASFDAQSASPATTTPQAVGGTTIKIPVNRCAQRVACNVCMSLRRFAIYGIYLSR